MFVETFKYIIFVQFFFLQIHLFGELITKLLIYYVDIIKYYTKWPMQYKRNLRIDGNLEISLFCLYLLNYVINQHARITNWTF